jgi:hypothetical protein
MKPYETCELLMLKQAAQCKHIAEEVDVVYDYISSF